MIVALILLIIIILTTFALFVWGYWRYDVVAALALAACVLFNIVPVREAFSGFTNPAVITVASIMLITEAIIKSGIMNNLSKRISEKTTHLLAHIALLCIITATLSAFMNNIGALAIMMPIAMKTAAQRKRSISALLLPLALSSALGGLVTAIGTPPNLLISNFRQTYTGHPFTMFDFTPVGLVVALAGIIFITLIGWRLIPLRRKASESSDEKFVIENYITEVRVIEDSKVLGQTLEEFENNISEEISIIGMIRHERKHFMLANDEILMAGDILIVEGSEEEIKDLIKNTDLQLVANEKVSADLRSERVQLLEAVVGPNSRLSGRSWRRARIKNRAQINLLALSRQGAPFRERIQHLNLRPGDVLLLQAESDALYEKLMDLGLFPLEDRGLSMGSKSHGYLSITILILSVMIAALNLLPTQIAFACGALATILLRLIPIHQIYDCIDWPVIILLGAIIPVGMALETTGATAYIVQGILYLGGHASPILLLSVILIVTMMISDFLNNAATVVIMAPIAATLAQSLHLDVNPFLMAVAIGGSCSFLTPIGHQNNVLVMGPGGYRFSDYYKIGLPLEIVVAIVAIPMILWVWPL